jgi:PDZ domain-containing protein
MTPEVTPNGQAPAGIFGQGQEPRGRLGRWALLIPTIVLALVFGFVRLPYFVFEPGPAQDVLPLIHIQDHTTYPAKGHLLLTAVDLFQPNIYEAVRAWLDRSQAVVPESYLLAPGQTQRDEFRIAISQMDTSKIDAAVVALTAEAGYPDKHGTGALIENVFAGTPAEGKLFAGDLIVAIDGDPVNTVDDVAPHITRAGTEHALKITVLAGGARQDVTLAPATVAGIDHPIVGISLVPNFPFPLTIDSGDIGGPSAGLMWTLGLIDVLTPGELTGGKVIAGTGTIDPDGNVGAIGGVEEKVVAAERAGAAVFFVPIDNAEAARSVARKIVIVPVRTFRDALSYLGLTP